MSYKKTFWMNVVGAIGWLVLSALTLWLNSVEQTTKHMIISAILYLCVIATPTFTALYLYHQNKPLLRNLALFGNYCGIAGAICYVLSVLYLYPTIIMSFEVLAIAFVFLVFAVPCSINLKAIKAS